MTFFLLPCFKMSTMSTFNWLALLVAADLQVCGVYYFRIDVSVKNSITYLLFESIVAVLESFAYVINKALVSVCSLVLRRFQYSFKQSATHNFLLWHAIQWKLSNFFACSECLITWLGENITPITVTVILFTAKKYTVFILWPPSNKSKIKSFYVRLLSDRSFSPFWLKWLNKTFTSQTNVIFWVEYFKLYTPLKYFIICGYSKID